MKSLFQGGPSRTFQVQYADIVTYADGRGRREEPGSMKDLTSL